MVCFFGGEGNIPHSHRWEPPPIFPPRPVDPPSRQSHPDSSQRAGSTDVAWPHDWSIAAANTTSIQHGNQAIKNKSIPRQLWRKHFPPGHVQFRIWFHPSKTPPPSLPRADAQFAQANFFKISTTFNRSWVWYTYPHFIRKSQLSSCRFKIGFHKPVSWNKNLSTPHFNNGTYRWRVN